MSRNVLVVGASRGIGARIAETFRDAGNQVVAWSRSGDAPAGVSLSQSVDVTDVAAITAALTVARENVGPLDVVIFNAGITDDGLALRMSDGQWRHVLSTNLDGAFYVARSAMADLIKKRAGSVIFISSVSPFMGVPGQANYAASKAGLVGLARSLASEVARRGVTVNVVAPGLIDTDMTRDMGDARDALVGQIPLGRIGHDVDVAATAFFLAGDGARYITGAVIPVDGGMAMGL